MMENTQSELVFYMLFNILKSHLDTVKSNSKETLSVHHFSIFYIKNCIFVYEYLKSYKLYTIKSYKNFFPNSLIKSNDI